MVFGSDSGREVIFRFVVWGQRWKKVVLSQDLEGRVAIRHLEMEAEQRQQCHSRRVFSETVRCAF